MSEFRLWLHERLARLDGVRERRIVALTAALLFAALALGPQAIQVVDAQVNQPELKLEELPTAEPENPVRLKAFSLNVTFGQVEFIILPENGTAMTFPGVMPDSRDPSRWELPSFMGEPGRAYTATARGFATTGAVQSSNSLTFTIFDPNAAQPDPNTGGASGSGSGSGAGSGTAPTPHVEMLQLNVIAGATPRLEPVAAHGGFDATAGFFRTRSLDLAFQNESPAAQGADGLWRTAVPVPGGKRYKVTFVGSGAVGSFESLPLEADVPASNSTNGTQTATSTQTAPPPENTTTPTNTVLPPAIALLAPQDGFSGPSPISMAARVANATATALLFEVLDPSGVTRTVAGTRAASGDWTAVFIGDPGMYSVGARTTLESGQIIPPPNRKSFSILAPLNQTQTATTTQTAPPPATAPPPPTAAPLVEVFSPLADAPPFAGAVPLTARVKNGVPDRVVAIVRADSGAETVVIAAKTATGDFWNALFEGPDGPYRFRIRATVAGTDVFSPEGAFAVKRPATAPAPSTTTTTPLPPPPPPADDTTAASGTLPPPPPPGSATAGEGTLPPPAPTGTVAVIVQVPPSLAEECRIAGILPERCAEWLKAKYQSRECLEAGAVTRETCAALLERLNLPVDETKTFGMVGDEQLREAAEAAREAVGKAFAPSEMPPALGRLLAFEPKPEDRWRVVSSRNDAPALLVLDTDADGLPDDLERRIGTDPSDADSDDDGFDDGTETKNGYNPLGAGAIERPVRGVEKALLEGRALEEPRGAETAIDASFTIAAEAAPEAEEESEALRLSGTAAPNSVVTIFIYSYLPVVVTTTTDESGNWTYDFESRLSEGRHEAYVSINDDTGKLVASSSPLAFFVREAQAVSEEDFLRPDVNVEAEPASLSRWFVWGGIALVAVALILVVAIVRQVKNGSASDKDAAV